MSSIKVNTAKALGQQSSLQNYQKKIIRIEEEIGEIRSGLSFNLQNRTQIVRSLSSVQSALQKSSADFGSLESILAEVMEQYQETEEKVKEQCGVLEKSTITDADVGTISQITGTLNGGTDTDNDSDSSDVDWFDDITDFLKKLFKLFNKFFGDEDGGTKNAFTDYIQKLVDFFRGDKTGLTGVSDWFGLAESGAGLWGSIYSLLEGEYSGLSDVWGDSADAIGVGGSLFGFIAGIMGMADVLGSDTATAGDKLSSVVDAGSGIIDVVKSIYDVVNTTVSTGLYTAASLWATFAKTITSSVSQFYKSIGNYAQDGSWDMGDTGATGVEVAIAGLSTMISALTFGVVSPESFGSSAEEISAALENWAADVGTAIGEWILSWNN